MLVVLSFYNLKNFKNLLIEIKPKIWLFLILIILFGLTIRVLFTTPHLEMYIDEPLYIEAGSNMLQHASQGDYFKSIGWPFLLSTSFLLFGASAYTAIYTSLFFGLLSALILFLFSYLLFKNQLVALFSSLLFLLFPIHIFWSTSAETNVTSLFFILLGMFFSFLYFSKQKYELFLLALSSFAFTAQIRPENYFFILLFFAGCFLFDNLFYKKILKINYFLPSVFIIFLSMPNFIQVWKFQSSDYQALTDNTTFFGLNKLINNSKNSLLIVFKSYPFFLNIFILVGFIFLFFKKRKLFIFTVLWFLSLWIIYYSTYINILGGKSRIYLSFYPIITIYISASIIFISDYFRRKVEYSKIIIFILALHFFVFLVFTALPKIPKMTDEKILLNNLPQLIAKDLPPNCTIITNEPVVITALTSFNAIRLNNFLNSSKEENNLKENDCLIFFEDIYCNYDFLKERQLQCRQIKKDYKMSFYKQYSQNNISIRFYLLDKLNN